MAPISEIERDRLLAAVRADFLGPRHGETELIESDPRFEYQAGVLAPPTANAVDLAGDAALTDFAEPTERRGAAEPDEDADRDGADVGDLGAATPALDPKSLPSSLGISFLVRAQSQPELDLLLTFARYEEEGALKWRRHPRHLHTGAFALTESRLWESSHGMTLRLRARELEPSLWQVTIFAVSNVCMPDERARPETGELIFQPQIRVRLTEPSSLAPFSSPRVDGKPADRTTEATFRNRLAFARGHLCSALWHDVDPELHPRSDGPEAYRWAAGSGGGLPSGLIEDFLRPHARTEYLPTYEVRAPDMRWNSHYGPAPELRAEMIANTFARAELVAALTPIVVGYRAWIAERESGLDKSNYPDEDRARLDECAVAAGRIHRGIETLAENEDARLAFCFANKAIALQAKWQDLDQFAWHPFQLAFFLLNISALTDTEPAERSVFDLLWFPTGGGKTEAYLALTAFSLAYRRRRAVNKGESHDGAGTTVLSRYTLRLLSLQQFRRATRLVTACEVLRTETPPDGKSVGWQPGGPDLRGSVWGDRRFSIGLWVGGGLTPNSLFTRLSAPIRGRKRAFLGAIDLLRPLDARRTLLGNATEFGEGAEPAQILECPACNAPTAVPTPFFAPGPRQLHFVFTASDSVQAPSPGVLSTPDMDVRGVRVEQYPSGRRDMFVLIVKFNVSVDQEVSPGVIDAWFDEKARPALGKTARLASTRPSRPGYFFRRASVRNRSKEWDFWIMCPNPGCPLTRPGWRERVPISFGSSDAASGSNAWETVPEPFQLADDPSRSVKVPIPAFTVDDQVYSRCPSVVIATVDKFARLAYEPRAAAIFGNVDRYHSHSGYFRAGVLPAGPTRPRPGESRPHPASGATVAVEPFPPIGLILQDELHLITGPLGSMVGAYEPVIEELCRGAHRATPKYIAATATIENAPAQAAAVFARPELKVFPPQGPLASDNFFAITTEGHAREGDTGRLYVGCAAIGRGGITPAVRLWASVMAAVHRDWIEGRANCDWYWTLVGYFNSIKELATQRALYVQDIPERLLDGLNSTRELSADPEELSGRTESLHLPRILNLLADQLPSPPKTEATVDAPGSTT